MEKLNKKLDSDEQIPSRDEIEKEIERLRDLLSSMKPTERSAIIQTQNELCEQIKTRNRLQNG